MTIKNFVEQQKKMDVNEWIKLIDSNGYSEFESKILAVADALNLIKCNLNIKPDFFGTIKKLNR